jgi:hypothetical protein
VYSQYNYTSYVYLELLWTPVREAAMSYSISEDDGLRDVRSTGPAEASDGEGVLVGEVLAVLSAVGRSVPGRVGTEGGW